MPGGTPTRRASLRVGPARGGRRVPAPAQGEVVRGGTIENPDANKGHIHQTCPPPGGETFHKKKRGEGDVCLRPTVGVDTWSGFFGLVVGIFFELGVHLSISP